MFVGSVEKSDVEQSCRVSSGITNPGRTDGKGHTKPVAGFVHIAPTTAISQLNSMHRDCAICIYNA